jgi:ankyrin repeat protein
MPAGKRTSQSCSDYFFTMPLLQNHDIRQPTTLLHYGMNMKFILTLLASLAASGLTAAGTNDLSTPLQRGLLEEEANHQLEAAIGDYKEAIEQFDHERQLAATAIFRLGECYRKLGRTNEANAQYERIVREFSDQTQLAALSKTYLPTGSGVVAAAEVPGSGLPPDEDKFLREVKESVQNSPDLVNKKMWVAAANGYVAVAEFLIAHGADVKRSDSLVEAAKNGNEAMVHLLLSHGAEVNGINNSYGRTALSLAVESGFMTVCRTLVDHGADVNAKDDTGATPLYVAVERQQLPAADFLITNKAEINVRVSNGMTPLTTAIRQGEIEMAKLLLEHHADANMETEPPNGPSTPLHLAIEGNQAQIVQQLVQLLLDHGAKPNEMDSGGEPILVYATKQGNVDVIRSLIQHGADVNAADKGGLAPLHWAVQKKDLSPAEILITNKAQIDAKTSEGYTPLTLAIFDGGREEMVKLLLDNHADANMETGPANNRHMPLIWAIQGHHTHSVQLLLEHGAKPNAVDSNGDTALADAIQKGNVETVRLLIDHGADVNFLDKQGRPPLAQLRTASAEAHPGMRGLRPPPGGPGFLQEMGPKIEELLIKAGADPDYDRRRAIWTYGDDGKPKDEVFQCASNSINHYTLLEALATIYQVYITQPSGRQTAFGRYAHPDDPVPFPDFARVAIHRLPGKGAEVLHVNVAEIFQSGDCSRDVALQPGDLIEIPKQEHRVADKWYGPSATDMTALNKCLLRTVRIVAQGHTNNIALMHAFADADQTMRYNYQFPQVILDPNTQWLAEALKDRKVDTVVRSFFLNDVVRDADVLLNTWDLSRVRLTRGSTKMTFDLTANPAPEVLLKDGDVIEIPELGESAPVTEAK